MPTIALLGDIMLGRMVGQKIKELGPDYPWGDTLGELKKADLRIANLECLISENGEPWPKKHCNFRAPLSAIECLQTAQIDCVSLANNHAMDFGFGAMSDMLGRLHSAGISYAGAGRNIESAMAPAIIQAGGMKVSVISLTDNTPSWSAGAEKPGVFHIPLWSPHLLDKFANSVMLWPKTSAQISSAISKARSKSDLVIFSAHTGPNNVERPSAILRQLANMAIKGADVFHGHSAHAFQGISMSRAKPILFDCGDFIDDYPHNPIYHNEWGFIYFLDFRETELQGMRLVPVEISNCQVNLAKGEAAKNIMARMEMLSKEMGTKMEVRGQRLIFQQQ